MSRTISTVLTENIEGTNMTIIQGALQMIVESLEDQAQRGFAKTNGNEYYGGMNMWGWLDEIVPQDYALAERVRKIFLRNCPREAAEMIDEIRKDLWTKILAG